MRITVSNQNSGHNLSTPPYPPTPKFWFEIAFHRYLAALLLNLPFLRNSILKSTPLCEVHSNRTLTLSPEVTAQPGRSSLTTRTSPVQPPPPWCWMRTVPHSPLSSIDWRLPISMQLLVDVITFVKPSAPVQSTRKELSDDWRRWRQLRQFSPVVVSESLD